MNNKEFMLLKSPQRKYEIYKVILDIRINNHSFSEVWRKIKLFLVSGITIPFLYTFGYLNLWEKENGA